MYFPESLIAIYQPANLEKFVEAGVSRWTDNIIDIQLTFGWGQHIDFSAEEALPKGPDLLYQNQYRLREGTDEWQLVTVPSPVVGMRRFDTRKLQNRIRTFVNDVIEKGFAGFPEQCFQARDNKVHRELLNGIYCFYVGTRNVSGLYCMIYAQY